MRHSNLIALLFLLSGSLLPAAASAQQPDAKPSDNQAQTQNPAAQNPPVQPERTPQQSEQARQQQNRQAEDTGINRDWTTRQRGDERMDMDRMRQRRMGRMDQDEDNRTVGRNWRRDDDLDHGSRYGSLDERSYQIRRRPRVKTCIEYYNGDEFCQYRD